MWSRMAIVGLLAVVGLALILGSASAQCRRCLPRPKPLPMPRVAVTLEDAAGQPLRTFRHRGQTFVLGQMGERYGIRIYNRGSGRVEAVLSVDGRDAVSGEVADYTEHRGYLVEAHGSVLVTGFRQSLDQVASFRFSHPDDSYSSRMGTPQHVGVVGVAVFGERRPVRVALAERQRRDSRARPGSKSASGGADSADAQRAPRESRAYRGSRSRPGLGTSYGESRYSPAVEVPFERRSRTRPDQIIRVYYDDLEGLEARGIQVFPVYSPPPVYPEPEPFPNARFAPPPPAR